MPRRSVDSLINLVVAVLGSFALCALAVAVTLALAVGARQ
jgi:hypothetical protein